MRMCLYCQKLLNLITIDLQDGFPHIPIHKDFTTYLGFYWNGYYYVWQVLPFGLNVSPYLFCKTLRIVIQYLRSKDLRLLSFVDDIMLCMLEASTEQDKKLCLQTLKFLGWNINHTRSDLEPREEIYRLRN